MIVLTLARKPILATLARTAREHGTGALNIDACRIAGVVQKAAGSTGFASGRSDGYVLGTGAKFTDAGRWPANVVFEHRPECRITGTRTTPGYSINRWDDGAKPFGGGAGHGFTSTKRPASEVPIWECAFDCPVRELGQQSGDTSSPWIGNAKGVGAKGGRMFGGADQRSSSKVEYSDGGDAGRYYKQFTPAGGSPAQ